eukprot:scaffold76329_cov54-Phaeocystis_antarctica.AAC.2
MNAHAQACTRACVGAGGRHTALLPSPAARCCAPAGRYLGAVLPQDGARRRVDELPRARRRRGQGRGAAVAGPQAGARATAVGLLPRADPRAHRRGHDVARARTAAAGELGGHARRVARADDPAEVLVRGLVPGLRPAQEGARPQGGRHRVPRAALPQPARGVRRQGRHVRAGAKRRRQPGRDARERTLLLGARQGRARGRRGGDARGLPRAAPGRHHARRGQAREPEPRHHLHARRAPAGHRHEPVRLLRGGTQDAQPAARVCAAAGCEYHRFPRAHLHGRPLVARLVHGAAGGLLRHADAARAVGAAQGAAALRPPRRL